MSHFYGIIEGAAKKPATQRGHWELVTHNNGWTSGVMVHSRQMPDGKDIHDIYITSGSKNKNEKIFIASVYEENGLHFSIANKEK